MIGFWWLLSIGVLILEIALLMSILKIYSGIHRQTHGRLMVGIELFSVFFIAQDTVGTWAMFFFSGHLGSSVSVPLAVMNLLGLAALIALYLTFRT